MGRYILLLDLSPFGASFKSLAANAVRYIELILGCNRISGRRGNPTAPYYLVTLALHPALCSYLLLVELCPGPYQIHTRCSSHPRLCHWHGDDTWTCQGLDRKDRPGRYGVYHDSFAWWAASVTPNAFCRYRPTSTARVTMMYPASTATLATAVAALYPGSPRSSAFLLSSTFTMPCSLTLSAYTLALPFSTPLSLG